jgi:hypothetical protein
MPKALEDLEDKLPDIFNTKATKDLVTRIEGNTPGKIPGAAKYDFNYHCKRFMIGQRVTGFDHGAPMYEDIDDSADLQEVMDKNLKGEAIIFKKMETFLKDGTVMVWVEYGVPKEMVAKKDGVLSLVELLSPKTSESELGEDDSEVFEDGDID